MQVTAPAAICHVRSGRWAQRERPAATIPSRIRPLQTVVGGSSSKRARDQSAFLALFLAASGGRPR